MNKLNSVCCCNQKCSYGLRKAVLPEAFLKNQTVSCLIFNEKLRHFYNFSLCFFGALARHLHSNHKLLKLQKKTLKKFIHFFTKVECCKPKKRKVDGMNDLPIFGKPPRLSFLMKKALWKETLRLNLLDKV